MIDLESQDLPRHDLRRLELRWRRGDATTNAWLTIPDPFMAEIVARAGFDSVCIDMQHGLVDFTSAVAMLQVTQALGTPTLVRVPWNEPSVLMRALDAGASGVIVPMVDTPEEAERAVHACRYPPRGRRSAGPIRAGLMTRGPYFDTVDDATKVFVMIESVEALENLDGILDTPGLSGVYIGPADLSLSMGHPPETDSIRPEHQAAVRRVIEACHTRSLGVGLHTAGPPFAAQAIEWGASFVTIATDGSALRIELERRLEALAELRA